MHLAPPCGTASAARNIQPGPPPLRSARFPMGLPNLGFVQRQRVGKANFLYAWTCKVILMLSAKGTAWSVENPASSLMWITDPFLQLLEAIPDLIAFSFHTCKCLQPKEKKTQRFGQAWPNCAHTLSGSVMTCMSVNVGAKLQQALQRQRNVPTRYVEQCLGRSHL